MKLIPLNRIYNDFYLAARINDRVSTDFQTDTGCSSTVISKEIAFIPFLTGKIKDEELKGYELAFYKSKTFLTSFILLQ